MQPEFHSFIWPSTKNFTSSICWWWHKYENEEKERNKIFYRSKAFATEKLDGTNIGKNDKGELFSRRLPISVESDMFLKTSLKHVKAADIKLVKEKLCERTFLDETLIENLIVYGELIVNEKYDYQERNLMGSWLVFGAMIIAEYEDLKIISNKLKERNFNFAVEDGNIRIFPNTNFFNLIRECNLDTPKVKGEDLSLYDIVLKNKEEMESGKLEGVVITIENFDQHLIYKWKGAQEDQPRATKDISEVFDLGPRMDEKTFSLFSMLHAVLNPNNEINPLVKKKKETQKSKDEKQKVFLSRTGHVETQSQVLKDRSIKKMITSGIFSSMTKYDDVNEFLDKEKYKYLIKEDVKQHFFEEKERQPNENEILFIDSTMENIINTRIKKKLFN